MFFSIRKLIVIFSIISAWTLSAAVKFTPLTNFKNDFTSGFFKSGSANVIGVKEQDGSRILQVKESGEKYVSGLGIALNKFNGMQSIYLSVSVKTVNLAKNAAVFYYWTDAAGKNLGSARYLAKVSGSRDWKEYAQVISSPEPLKTAGIKVYYSVYRAKGDGYALFKSPVIRLADANDSTRKKQNAAKPVHTTPELSAAMFKHGFSNKMHGVPYTVERGGYGWLLMTSAQRLKREKYQVAVTAPKGIDFELYLANGKRSVYRPAKITPAAAGNTYTFGPLNAVWYYWGNVMLFKVGKNVPDKFNIKLTFSDNAGRHIFSETIPCKTINRETQAVGKSSFANRMFYAYPLRRIDFSDKRAKYPQAVLDYLKKHGVTSVGYLEFANDSPFPFESGEVISHSRFFPYRVSSPALRKLLTKYQIPMAVNLSGISSDIEIDTGELAAKGLPIYRELLNKNKNEKYRTSQLVWITDYEPYAYEGPVTKYSFSPESIKAFRQFINLPTETELTPRLILTKYLKPWVEFRCRQRADLIKTQVKALREFNPKALFALCAMPQPGTDENQFEYFKRFGIDLRLFDPYVDMHLPMIYGDDAMFYRRTDATVTQLKKPVYVVVTCGYGRGVHRPQRLFRIMAGSAFLGAKGVYHWPGLKSMDGEFLQNMHRAMNLISEIEPFVKNSKRLPVGKIVSCPGAKTENFFSAVRIKDQACMIFLANEGKNTTLYPVISLPENVDNQKIIELVDKKKISTGKRRFRLELPPRSIRVIFAGAENLLSNAELGVIDVNAVELKAKVLQDKMASLHRNGAAHNMSYSFKGSILEVNTPSQNIKFDMNDCALGQWQLKEKGRPMKILSSLGRDYFDYPATLPLKNIPVELENIKITKSNVQMQVSFRLKDAPYDGLVVRKIFVIARNTPEIKVKIRVIPAGGYRQFALRVNHTSAKPDAVFYIGGKPAGNIIRFGNVYTRKGFDLQTLFQAKNIVGRGAFSANSCGLMLPGEKLLIKCLFSDNVQALMSWHDSTVNTMELIYGRAYPDDDPHKIKEFEYAYTLQSVVGRN